VVSEKIPETQKFNVNMKHVLIELVVRLLWNWMVVGSNLAKQELSFLFAKTSFWHECEGSENPSHFRD